MGRTSARTRLAACWAFCSHTDLTLTPCNRAELLALCRIYSALRALVFGEDFSSDPVSRLLGLLLAFCSHGRISVNTQMFSQVGKHVACCPQELWTACGGCLLALQASLCSVSGLWCQTGVL